MKLHPTQFGVRENTASSRQHASRLAENSSSQELVRELERPQNKDEARPPAAGDVEIIDLTLTDATNEATGEEREETVQSHPAVFGESAAQAAADALRLTINNPSNRRNLRQTTVNTLWEHYCREELPVKEMSTQDAYTVYARNWILPRWGNLLLEEVRTVEVERWLRAAGSADGTKAKIKCVMSALFSHAVRWEICGHNPISSGIPVGAGGKRGPSAGVRVSAKHQEAPLFLSPEQVALGLTKLAFRDQLLVSAYGRDDAGRDGRTSTHDPRLFASQQSPRVCQPAPVMPTLVKAGWIFRWRTAARSSGYFPLWR
jgi:hypothetical protein